MGSRSVSGAPQPQAGQLGPGGGPGPAVMSSGARSWDANNTQPGVMGTMGGPGGYSQTQMFSGLNGDWSEFAPVPMSTPAPSQPPQPPMSTPVPSQQPQPPGYAYAPSTNQPPQARDSGLMNTWSSVPGQSVGAVQGRPGQPAGVCPTCGK